MPKGDEPFGIRWFGMALADSSNMSALAQDASGNWHATCQGTPFPTQMMVSADGKVGKDTGYAGMSEDHVRSILTDAGCSTISAPSQASDSVHEVPASNWVRSMTLTPASAA